MNYPLPTEEGAKQEKMKKGKEAKLKFPNGEIKRMVTPSQLIMIITLFWNIRGVRSNKAIHRLKRFAHINKSQFIAIFEPFVAKGKIYGYNKFLGYHNCIANTMSKFGVFGATTSKQILYLKVINTLLLP